MTEDDVSITGQLWQRSPKPPDWESENRVLRSLGRQLTQPLDILLKYFTEIAEDLCRAGTAGVSLCEMTPDGEEILRWVALTGTHQRLEGNTIPRNSSPCGVCLGRGEAQLYAHPAHYFTDWQQIELKAVELLVVPLQHEGGDLGTFWIVSHDEQRQFDSEDLRVMTSLADFLIGAIANDRERQQAELLLTEQKKLLELTASGHPLDECLSSICTSVTKLNPGVRACILLVDVPSMTFHRSIMPDFPSSLGRGLKDAPINELAIGTCGEAVYCGQPVTCADIANDERWSQGWRELCLAHNILACHSSPIIGENDKPLGSLMLCFDQVRQPREWEYRLADFGTHIARIVFESERTNLALHQSEARFRRIFECNMVGMGVWTRTGEITEANDALLNLLGYTRQELESGAINWRKLTPPEHLDQDERSLAEIEVTGVCTPFEKEYIHKSGRRVPVLIGGASFLSTAESGVFFAVDLTERKLIDAQLRENEERLQLAIAAVRMVAWEWNPFQNTIITTSNFPEIYGLNEIQTAEQGFALVHPEDRSRHQATVEKAVATSNSYYSEFRFIRPDNGSVIWLEERGKPIFDGEGTLQKLIGVTMDISERKQAEEALRYSEERYRTLFESIDEGFCIIEMIFDEQDKPLDYRFLEINPAFEKQTGLEQAQGKTARQLVPELEDHWFEIYGRVALTGEPLRFENHSPQLNRWFDVYAFRFERQESHKVALIFQNISERKQAELQLQRQAHELTELNQSLMRTSQLLTERNQELNSFTYIVSHDLKAPLRAIANLSQWLADDLEGQLDEDNQRQIQLLQSRVERMAAMIDGLLAYSRVGRTEVATQRVDVGQLLDEILDSLAPPPSFTIQIPSELPMIVGKRLLLSQVFANLISNAIKHHPRPDGQIDISAARKGQFYEFAIADDGDGIAPEDHEKIFGIFQTLNARDVKESTGIGLSIVKKIVETEGGKIGITSQLGGGATFRFTWPQQPPQST